MRSSYSEGLYTWAVDGLLEVKAHSTLRLLTDAAKLLFDDDVPEDREARADAIRKIPNDDGPAPEWADRLEQIDRAYCEDPDGLGVRLEAFARERGLVQPFDKNSAEQATP